MKKFFTYILLFFAFFAIVDIGVGFVCDYMQHHSKSGSIKQFDDLCLNDKHDVIVMGSSRALHHYVPQILEDSLGLNIYNAGVDGNGVILSYGILQMIISRYTPKCVILDVAPGFDIYQNVEDDNCVRYLSHLKPYYRQDGVDELFRDVSFVDFIKCHSGLYRYNSNMLLLFKNYKYGGKTYLDGYSPLHNVMREYETGIKSIATKNIDPIKVKYLNAFIMCCLDHDIKLILALSPMYKVEDQVVQDYVHDLANKNGIPVLDYYSDKLYQNDKYLFQDVSHLNHKGASLFSKQIGSSLSNIINNEDGVNKQ